VERGWQRARKSGWSGRGWSDGANKGPAVSTDGRGGQEEGQLGNPCTALKHADTLPRCCQVELDKTMEGPDQGRGDLLGFGPLSHSHIRPFKLHRQSSTFFSVVCWRIGELEAAAVACVRQRIAGSSRQSGRCQEGRRGGCLGGNDGQPTTLQEKRPVGTRHVAMQWTTCLLVFWPPAALLRPRLSDLHQTMSPLRANPDFQSPW
jgi:hypothetical protein